VQKKLTLEQQILVSLVSHPEYMLEEDKALLQTGFPQSIQKVIDQIILIENFTPEIVESLLSEDEKAYIQDLSISKNFVPSESLFKQLMQQFHKKHWKSIVTHIKMKLIEANQEKNNFKVEMLLKQFNILKNQLIKK
jgi:hypothetical protein